MSAVVQSTSGRRRVRVQGLVQGVGFRPFVYTLARGLGLGGSVRNTPAGVEISIEGERAALDAFLLRLRPEAPPLSRIDEVDVDDESPCGAVDFLILESAARASGSSDVAPDTSVCDECLREMNETGNRRSDHPFINCTNCGPRYTITRDIPYDRSQTTMSVFAMCRECRSEYDDPQDRRFHAQPNSCPRCGPTLWLDRAGGASASAVENATRLLADGKILAIRGVGGFHLACDATSSRAVAELRERKRRPHKPLAVMARDLAAANELCILSDADRAALTSRERPIVVAPRRPACRIAAEVAPGGATLGVMLPYTPLHHLLLRPFEALVMTSGNRGDEPIVASNAAAREELETIADELLLHDREIEMRVDDSIVRTIAGRARVLRRARGWVPAPIDLGRPVEELLACGSDLKSTFCLTRGTVAILSQHLGDLEQFENVRFFHETLDHLKRLFRVTPRAVAHDLHPDYASTRLAREAGLHSIAVQHHHAHVASCMAENRIDGPVIGVALDGTGLGLDGTIWGGELLVADYRSFIRRGHLRPVPLAGGDAAVRQPWRVALAYLRDALGTRWREQDLPLMRAVPAGSVDLVERMIERGVQVVPTSSCGRLFDAVASILGIRHEITYEAQAAIELEALADASVKGRYPFEIDRGFVIDFRPAIAVIAHDASIGKLPALIAGKFHNTVVAAIAEAVRRIGAEDGLRRVCLSGGVFQNALLTERMVQALERAGFEVFLHERVPTNDGGISLGQAVIADAILGGR